MAIQNTLTTTTDVIAHDGERKTMHSKVSENGAARIASMVVNMYADPTSAVTREYIANAVDATIAAGTNMPVEVTIPTLLSPTLIVKDYGVGMDASALENAFLAFAESTKGDTNDQVGGLGVGAKSAWTICASFIVDTVKDGKRNVVRASRDLEHEVMVSDADVDLPNGTTVTIPVNADVTDWRAEVVKVAVFHKRGAVLVDGKPVDSVQSGKHLGPVRLGRVEGVESQYTVLSGGTMFGVPATLKVGVAEAVHRVRAIITLPVGSFSHTPSRDHLIADERTRAALKDALSAYTKAHDAAQKRIERKAKTDISAALTMRAEYLNGERSSKILPLPYEVDFASPLTYTATRRGSRASVWNRATRLRRSVRELDQLSRTVVVVGVPEGKVLKGIGRYMDTEHPYATTVIALPEGCSEVGFKVSPSSSEDNATFKVNAKTHGVTAVAYMDLIAASKELSAAFATKKTPVTQLRYETLIRIDGKTRRGSYTLSEVREIIDQAANEVAITYGGQDRYMSITRVAPLNNFVIIDSGRRSDKPILGEFADAVPENVYREKVISEAEAALSDDDIARFVITGSHTSRFRCLVAVAHEISGTKGVPDEVVTRVKKLSSLRDVDLTAGVPSHADAVLSLRQYHYGYTRVSALTSELEGEWKSLLAAYPLLEAVNSSFLADLAVSSESYDAEKLRHIIRYVTSVPPVAVPSDI